MIDSRGRIYLLSAETGKIYVHGPDEALLFSFGTAGGSPGQLSQPRSLAIDEQRELIYVVDYMRHTILVYNLDGEFLFELGGLVEGSSGEAFRVTDLDLFFGGDRVLVH